MTDLDYEEDRVVCPNCGTLNEPDTGLPCSMCNYIPDDRSDREGFPEDAKVFTSPERPLRSPVQPRAGLSPEEATDLVARTHGDTLRGFDATPERRLRRHLDDRTVKRHATDDGWPVPGCCSPARETRG